jgi:hypothetical protein
MARKAMLLALAVFATACSSTAGPFVTSISNAGDGKVAVEKCKAVFNSFTGVVTTGQCITNTVYLGEPPAAPARRVR